MLSSTAVVSLKKLPTFIFSFNYLKTAAYMFKVIFSILSLLVGYGIYAQGKPTIELNREKLSKDPRLKKKTFELPKS